MKILYICADFGIPVLGTKGASVHVREMVSALNRAGHSVVLAAPKLQKVLWEKPEEIAGRLLHLPPAPISRETMKCLMEFEDMLGETSPLPGQIRRMLYNKEMSHQLLRHFTTHPPDFIYERAALFSTVGVMVAEALAKPLILELNAPLADEQSLYRGTSLGALAKKTEQFVLSRSEAVLTVSSLLKNYAVSAGAKPTAVHVSPNGVNIQNFQTKTATEETKATWGLGSGPIIGFVGGLRPWHGVMALPKLAEQLNKNHPDLKIVIVGEGPLRMRLQNEFEARGCSKNVLFTGAVSHENVAALIPTFDIAVAPYEKLDHDFYFSPLKLFEYMACGVAVVAAEAGQIGEIITQGRTGLLYAPGETTTFIMHCERLLSDPRLRKEMGQAAAKEVRSNYSWDHNASRVISIFKTLKKQERPS
ncbi:MAG: glycosyltransferase family 4 protein [Nitrospirae bacterium]|nr:glycosyltransferase family 4 protein [Candidatus Manganitrophaceae bacterium]